MRVVGLKRSTAGLNDWWLALAICIAVPIGLHGADGTLRWEEGNAYSSSFLYNGFHYKVIRTFDQNDPTTSLSIGISADASDNCPGRIRKCLSLLVLVHNEGTKPFDVDPTKFEGTCQGKKPRTLAYYRIPKYLSGATPPGVLLLGNTVAPGNSLRGVVWFNGSCVDSVVRIPIELGSTRLAFEFPFTLNK